MKNILVTGGTGFIGSHTCISLIEQGYKITIIDSCFNSSPSVIKNILLITKRLKESNLITFYKGDIRDKVFLNKVFIESLKENNPIEAVIHFAGLKAADESVRMPLIYWDNNVYGSICLFNIMEKFHCRHIVFSSSATIYGNPKSIPIHETFEINPINPYGHSKAAVENILREIYISNPKWKIINLRYFNPIGAHESGDLGERPLKNENNLFPILCKVAYEKDRILKIFGRNWPTSDGTAIRDYIHVMDLADAHVKSLNFIFNNEPQIMNLNVGTGLGLTVLEMVETFMKINNCEIPYEFCDRRIGDVPILVANNKKAISTLKWQPKRNISDMCLDGWRWQQKVLNEISRVS